MVSGRFGTGLKDCELLSVDAARQFRGHLWRVDLALVNARRRPMGEHENTLEQKAAGSWPEPCKLLHQGLFSLGSGHSMIGF